MKGLLRSNMLLGLDINSFNTGWCVFDSWLLLDYGIIEVSNKLSPFKRLVSFGTRLSNILDSFLIETAVIEDGFYSSNLRTTKLLAYFTGVAIYELVRREVRVDLISVSKVRKFFGKKLTKQDIFSVLNSTLNLDLDYDKFNDVTDAIAVAVSYMGLKEELIWEEDVSQKLVNLKIC